jgi:hypothetical protein
VNRTGLVGYYLLAILAVTGIGVGALVFLEVTRAEVDRGLVAQIVGMILPTLVALLALLRGEANGQALQAVRQEQTSVKQTVERNHEDLVTTVRQAVEESELASRKDGNRPAIKPYRNLPGGES